MRTHRSDFTTEELVQWLPKFQTELTEDFHTPDGTRRPSVYQFHYDDFIYGCADEYAERLLVFADPDDTDGQTAEEYLATLWENDPQKICDAIENDDFTGMKLDGETVILEDEDDFLGWVKHEKLADICGVMTRYSVQNDHLHLTRKAAERDLAQHPHRHPKNARILSDHFWRSPDLHRLLELVYALDLEKSTLVFKES